MAISSDELERLASDTYKDRLIPGTLYCADCGYNLRTLPYVHICPECGNPYDARPLAMTGIFAPQDIELPFRDMLAALACGASAFILGYGAFSPPDLFRLLLGLFFAVLAVVFFWQSCARFSRSFKAIAIARRIAQEEEAEE
jgi:hypothetical protein